MDALDLLKQDHDRIRHTCQQLKTAKGEQEKRQLIQQIDGQIATLFHVEETILYTHFKDYDAFKGVLGKIHREHDTAKEVLGKLRMLQKPSEEDVGRLTTAMEQHMTEEERELFPLVRHEMRRSEREKLGRVMQAAKDERSVAA